ncbi:hypothetical protein DM02DRAFT_619750 [Periconia macrospinosa]|uniref:Uncharacterized protein n=1 Tax=Periconia macrospinosa TaxID=97972 RepID=A0A2V1D3Y5_9PLEO|nr:hypothetical protein DM02DRAFT_619750 [Periconia macrospinosa]
MKTFSIALFALPATLALPATQQQQQQQQQATLLSCACVNPEDGTNYNQGPGFGICEYAYYGTIQSDGWCIAEEKYMVGRWNDYFCSFYKPWVKAVCKPA